MFCRNGTLLVCTFLLRCSVVCKTKNETFYKFLFSIFSTYRTQFLKQNLVRHKIKKCGLIDLNMPGIVILVWSGTHYCSETIVNWFRYLRLFTRQSNIGFYIIKVFLHAKIINLNAFWSSGTIDCLFTFENGVPLMR